MSRSSGDHMRRSSTVSAIRASSTRGEPGSDEHGSDGKARLARGQVEPIAALVALLAVGLGLSVYAGAIANADPASEGRATAEVVCDRVHDEVTRAGVTHPDRLTVPADIPVDERRVGIAVVTTRGRWTAGERNATRPYPPGSATAERPVSVRISAGEQVRGELRVVVIER